MSSLVSNFLPNSASNPVGAFPSCHSFSIRTSSQDPNLTIVHPADYPKDAPPLYSILADTKANLLLFAGSPGPVPTIGETSTQLFSSATKLIVRGQQNTLKMSKLSGNFSLESPTFGKLKWKVSQLTGSSLRLYDSSGQKLAELKSVVSFTRMGEKKLEILVPCDGFFQELVVLSAVYAKKTTKAVNEAAAEVSQAVAGVA